MNKIFFLVLPLLFIGARQKNEQVKKDILSDTVIQSELLLQNAERYAEAKGIKTDTIIFSSPEKTFCAE